MSRQADKVLIFDFGGQYAHLIARRVRELGYVPQIVPATYSKEKILADSEVKALVLSGGARSVYEKNAPKFDKRILHLNFPTLGICYGHQLIAHFLGGRVKRGASGEYGNADLKVVKRGLLLSGIKNPFKVWMNHRDTVAGLPAGFRVLAKTQTTPIAAFGNPKAAIYGVQFHPEVSHTDFGKKILVNFLKLVSLNPKTKSRLDAKQVVDEAKVVLYGKRAIVGLSGGVDSSTAAVLISKAIGKNLLAVYVDTGLMRHGETEQVRKIFRKFPLRFKVVQAAPRFFRKLRGVSNPEEKRRRIGKLFIRIFEEEAKKFKAQFLIQGTIYSDRIESGLTKYSSRIKSHHNVGGLPKKMKLKVYEPLRDLYKDEVRRLARRLGLPLEIIQRQVFPGPGLAIRILGEVTPEKVNVVRRADRIIQEELKHANYLKKIWMAFPVLLSIKSVGIQGDERTYKYPLVIRIVESKDAMTANFSKVPYKILEKLSTRITNEITEVNRVVYDISNKPPATMEWE